MQGNTQYLQTAQVRTLTFAVVFAKVIFTFKHALMPIPIAQITICSTTFFTSGSLTRVYCPTFTFIITASKVSFTLVRTSLELCLEGIGKEVSSAVSVTLDPVRKAFVFTRCPITESAQKARGQEEGNSTHLKTETFPLLSHV